LVSRPLAPISIPIRAMTTRGLWVCDAISTDAVRFYFIGSNGTVGSQSSQDVPLCDPVQEGDVVGR
jgi:hypothetical protein